MVYYPNANSIEIVAVFISSASSNSTVCHFVTPDIIVNYSVTMAISLIVFRVVMSNCKEKVYILSSSYIAKYYILNRYLDKVCT